MAHILWCTACNIIQWHFDMTIPQNSDRPAASLSSLPKASQKWKHPMKLMTFLKQTSTWKSDLKISNDENNLNLNGQPWIGLKKVWGFNRFGWWSQLYNPFCETSLQDSWRLSYDDPPLNTCKTLQNQKNRSIVFGILWTEMVKHETEQQKCPSNSAHQQQSHPS